VLRGKGFSIRNENVPLIDCGAHQRIPFPADSNGVIRPLVEAIFPHVLVKQSSTNPRDEVHRWENADEIRPN
jgi:hypothetical protein